MHDLLGVALIEMRVLRQDALHELDLIIVASSRAQLGNLEPISSTFGPHTGKCRREAIKSVRSNATGGDASRRFLPIEA
jgi:hypothetical protein